MKIDMCTSNLVEFIVLSRDHLAHSRVSIYIHFDYIGQGRLFLPRLRARVKLLYALCWFCDDGDDDPDAALASSNSALVATGCQQNFI